MKLNKILQAKVAHGQNTNETALCYFLIFNNLIYNFQRDLTKLKMKCNVAMSK